MINSYFAQIKNILLNHWDPILIQNNEALNDEYDCYALKLEHLLKNENITEIELFNFLKQSEDEDIGLETTVEVKKSVARKLIAIKFMG